MSGIVGAKAISLVTRGGVHETDERGVYTVEGSEPGKRYVVTLGADESCTCRAGECGRRCYHLAAAKIYSGRKRAAES